MLIVQAFKAQYRDALITNVPAIAFPNAKTMQRTICEAVHGMVQDHPVKTLEDASRK